MAHELAMTRGKARMMYCEEAPWHGLGTPLMAPATAEEAIKAARLNWDVEKHVLYVKDRGRYRAVDDHFGIVPGRGWGEEERPVLGIVGKTYAPVQNREAFSFFDELVGRKQAIYHTAGALGRGERIWILARLPGDIDVVGDDVVHRYLLLSNSHDGHGAVQVRFTPIRVVCQNTLSAALAGQGTTVRVPHQFDPRERLRQATDLLGIVSKTYTELAGHYRAMTRVSMDNEKLTNYVVTVFPEPKDPTDQSAQRRVTVDRTEVTRLFTEGRGNNQPRVRGTLWAAYNAVTEYADFRSVNTTQAHRLDSVWYGAAASIKHRALQEALSLVGS